MSITRTLLRIATREALSGATLAEHRVFDSVIDPTDNRISDREKRPMIAVYTDDHGSDEGQGRGDFLQDGRLDLVLECIVASRITVPIEGENDEVIQLSVPNSDAGTEIILDLLEAQAIRALVAGIGPWPDLWRELCVADIRSHMSRRGVSAEQAGRFAVRQITLSVDLLIDPDRGLALDPSGPWARALVLMDGNPALSNTAQILRSELEGEPMTDWRRAAARLGVNLSTVEALGLGPLEADDPVPLVEGEVIP
ncbi:hypothetical protein [Paracoccus sp. KR1-242]|uniref:hypothetical protein n=1 Tax=Paracoccus sp. KR1-242 TaxID=3410028 RepID=UPI003C0CB96F